MKKFINSRRKRTKNVKADSESLVKLAESLKNDDFNVFKNEINDMKS